MDDHYDYTLPDGDLLTLDLAVDGLHIGGRSDVTRPGQRPTERSVDRSVELDACTSSRDRFSLACMERSRLSLIGTIVWSLILMLAAFGVGYGVYLSLLHWTLVVPGVVLTAVSARILLGPPPRPLRRRQ
jgi:hypothetical protein